MGSQVDVVVSRGLLQNSLLVTQWILVRQSTSTSLRCSLSGFVARHFFVCLYLGPDLYFVILRLWCKLRDGLLSVKLAANLNFPQDFLIIISEMPWALKKIIIIQTFVRHTLSASELNLRLYLMDLWVGVGWTDRQTTHSAIRPPYREYHIVTCGYCVWWISFFLGRLPKVDLIILEGGKCPYVRPSVRPQKVSSISMKFGIYR